MKQILHIFRKDVRHHWIEIVVSLALVVAYGYYEVRNWGPGGVTFIGPTFLFDRGFLPGLVQFLTPVAWCLLLVRIIHDESLVGDKQFWVTRPYKWTDLLGSKVLFLLLLVWIPLFVLQLVLLTSAGFHPTSYAPGLLWMQLALCLSIFLPLAVLATVTRSLAHLLIALLIVVLYFAGVSWCSSLSRNSFSFRDVTDQIPAELFVITCVAVILLQYSRRETRRSWLLIGTLAAVVPLLSVVLPYEYFLRRTFPILPAPQSAPFQLTLLPPVRQSTSFVLRDKNVLIQIPFNVTGVAPDSIVNLAGFTVISNGSDNANWTSGWKRLSHFAFPDPGKAYVSFSIDREHFKRLQGKEVELQLAIAYDLYKGGQQRDFVIPTGRFAMPEMGWCSSTPEAVGKLHCAMPLRHPTFLVVSGEAAKSTCPLRENEKAPEPGQMAREMIQSFGSGPAEFGISPVVIADVFLPPVGDATKYAGMGLCPRTPVTLSDPQFVRSNRIEVQFPKVRLADYAQAQSQVVFRTAP